MVDGGRGCALGRLPIEGPVKHVWVCACVCTNGACLCVNACMPLCGRVHACMLGAPKSKGSACSEKDVCCWALIW